MIRMVVYCAFLCVFSGCLLTQTDPAGKDKTKPKGFIVGRISAEDMIVSNQSEIATFQAKFSTKSNEAGKPAASASFFRFQNRRSAVFQLFDSRGSRAPECKKRRLEKKPAPPEGGNPKPGAAPLVSVGKLGFGPALQQSLMILNPSAENQYGVALKPGFPSGLYQVITDGSEALPPVQEILSMPEEVRYLRINGRDFGDPLTEFKPAETLQLFWRNPAADNAMNGVIVQIITEDENTLYAAHCATLEEDVPSISGYKHWNIDSAWFSEFPKTGSVSFYFIRAHQNHSVKKTSDIISSGLRTFYSHLEIE